MLSLALPTEFCFWHTVCTDTNIFLPSLPSITRVTLAQQGDMTRKVCGQSKRLSGNKTFIREDLMSHAGQG